MKATLRIYFCVLLSSTFPRGWGEVILGVETDEFDFDGLPGAQHEFKVEVGAGKEECFYQKVVAGGKMHVSFEVVYPGGSDRQIDMYIINIKDRRVHLDALHYKSDGVIEHDATETGTYAVCLDNSISRMASKLVYVYMVTYVESEWQQYQQEIEDVQLTVGNFTTSITAVQQSIQEALLHQAHSRMQVIKDWYLITGNNDYVQKWSIAQCVIVICSTCFQVYFLRRLFRTTNITPTSKPRA